VACEPDEKGANLFRTRYLTQAGVIAVLYAVLTLAVLSMPMYLGWGIVQFRLSEALTILALITPAAIPGLTIGTALANAYLLTQVGPIAFLDVIFGSLATFIGAVWAWKNRAKPLLAMLGPVVSNALIVPAYLPILLTGLGLYTIPVLGIDIEGNWLAMYAFGFLSVGFGQAVVVYGLGWPLYTALKRTRYTDDYVLDD